MMLRILSLGVLFLLVAAACGNDDAASDDERATEAVQETVTADPSPTATASPTASPTATTTPTAMASPTATASPAPSATPAATASPAPTATPQPSDPVADIPVYPEAREVASGDWSQADAAVSSTITAMVILDEDIERILSYPNVEFALYASDASPMEVFDWYRANSGDWAADPNVQAYAQFTGGLTPSAFVLRAESQDSATMVIVGEVEDVTNLALFSATR
jgi:hypothetical protein